MAAIDKTYGDKHQAMEIFAYLEKIKEEVKSRCGYDPMKYTYGLDWDNWDPNNENYDPESVYPMTNFPVAVDCALAQRNDLPKHLEDELRFQYEEAFDEMKNALGKGGMFDFEPWQYEVATKFKIDWSGYKFNDKGFDHLCIATGRLDVEASYFGKDNKDKEYGTTLWFVENDNFNPVGWVCDKFEFKCCNGWTSNCGHPKARTLKSLIRWCRKMKFPKGTVLTVETGYVGGDFKIHCR